MSTILHDLRYGLRMLWKSPGFTAAAVFSLALGIGANTAVFSVINAVLLKTLPYPDPDRIVLIWGEAAAKGTTRGQMSATDVADLRARNHVFDDISTYASFRPVLAVGGEPERVAGAQVGDGFFAVMKAQPLLGRTFTAEEQEEGKDYVAVLTHELWQKRFAGDPKVVGQTVKMSGRPYIIVGVMPPGFQSLPVGLLDAPAQFYRPVAEPAVEKDRSSRHLRAIARLKPGVTLASAQSEVNLIARQLAQEHPATNAGLGVRLVLLKEDLVSPIRPALFMLFGAVAFLLLIACANVGNLLLARSLTRHREVAIRAALGAGRVRLVRQFLTESVILAAAGGALGLMAAVWGTTLIESVGAKLFPLLGVVAVDARVLAFSGILSLLTGIVFGSAPAWRASRTDLNETLNDGGRTPSAGSTRSPLRSALVITEVALAMILLIGAGLLVRSMARLQAVDPGFKAEHLVTMNVVLPGAKYPKEEDWNNFYNRLLQRLETLPDVAAAGLTSVLPISTNFDQRTIEIEGQPRAVGENPDVDNYIVTPDYARAMSINLLRGRNLDARDTAAAPQAVLVSEAMARKFWPGEDAIGKRLRFDISDPEKQQPWRTVMGVVGDVKQYGLDTPGVAAMYVPFPQMPTTAMTLVVRTRSEPEAMVATMRHEIQALDPEQAVFGIATMEGLISDSTAVRRFSMFLLLLFAGLALLLAAIGLYGVLAQSVAQRTHEIGIRMALGAQTRDVLRLIVSHGLALTAIGLLCGLVGAFGLTRLMSSLLFDVGASDPATFAGIAALLLAVAFLACYLPARRAAKLDPMTALARN